MVVVVFIENVVQIDKTVCKLCHLNDYLLSFLHTDRLNASQIISDVHLGKQDSKWSFSRVRIRSK